MARHEVVIHENTSTATRESAPYLGSYIAKETVALTEFAVAVGAKCGLPAIQVIAIIGGAFDAIAALEREALVRVHTDLGVVCGVITGSFPTADAAFDPGRNTLELALRLDDTLRLDLADTVPTIITDANLTKLRVDNVMDLEVERPMNLIHGQHVFRVAGFNMVLNDEGAAVYLQNALGTTFPLVIDHVTSHQLFTAHTAELLPGGDYKLVVKSRAGDAAGPLQTSFRKVKYLRVEDPVGPVPTITSATSEAMEENHVVADGGTVTYIVGEHLDPGRFGAEVVLEDGEGNRVGHGTGWWSEASNSLEVTLEHDADPATATGTIKVTFAAGTAEHGVLFE